MEAVKKILSELISGNKTPAVHYIHFDKENIIYEFKEGYSNIHQKNKVNDQTTFHACSVTKTFTALAVLQLAEKGKLEIEKPVKDHWHEFPYNEDITIHQLLSHSAGIPNPIPLNWIHLDTEQASFDRDIFFHAIFEKHKKTRSHPNEKFFYSNLGYVLLGQLIEKISGTTYEDYMEANILRKCGLSPNELSFTISNIATNATGYQKNFSLMNLLLVFFLNKSKFMGKAEGKWRPFKNFYINGPYYGGLIGTAHGFRKYLQQMLLINNTLINEEYRKLLFTENHTTDNKPTGMCLSWFSGHLNSKQYFAHPGGGGGFYCEIRLYPEINKGSVIMFNRTGMSNEKFLDKTDQFFI